MSGGPAPADLVVVGRVATLGGASGLGWVDAVAIRGQRIVAAGSRDAVEQLGGSRTRRVVLAPDEVAVPGLTDAHLHLADAAKEAGELDLAGAPTMEVGLAAIADRHAALGDPAAWLEGRGWSADRWGRWPTSADLAAVAPGRKVALWQSDHHVLWASAEAVAAAGIGPATDDPPGGSIARDRDGRPTGVLLENAVLLLAACIPPASADDLARSIPPLTRDLLALGIVAVHDPATLVPDPGLERAVRAYVRLADAGALAVRVHASIRSEALATAAERGLRSGMPLGKGDDSPARMGWLKLFADGTLGSRTAAMLDPFELEPGHAADPDKRRGLFRTPPAILRELVDQAAEQGIASQVHAIGDAALRAALDALEPTAGRSTLRPRVEHVQLIDPVDLGRFAAAGIAASVQPRHLRTDAAVARLAWGPRAERAGYAWRALADSGALIPFGTDAPVEPIDPWPGIEMAVVRRDAAWPAGTAPFGPNEALTLDRALRAACIDGPLSAGETDRGRLVDGQRADLVVLPAGALDEPVEPGGPLGRARPRLVIAGGIVAFET